MFSIILVCVSYNITLDYIRICAQLENINSSAYYISNKERTFKRPRQMAARDRARKPLKVGCSFIGPPLDDKRRHNCRINELLRVSPSSLDDQFCNLSGITFIADKLCDNVICIILYQFRPSIPMITMLLCIDEIRFEGPLVMVNVRRAGGPAVPWWNKVDCAGSRRAAVRFGNDRTIFVATVNFEPGIVGRSVAVVEDFLSCQRLYLV
jgi:hypothetical protein